MTEQEFLQAMNRTIDQMLSDICAVNCKLYRELLEMKDNEELAQEFSDKIGNELSEYEWTMFHKGRQAVIEILCDRFGEVQYEKYIA